MIELGSQAAAIAAFLAGAWLMAAVWTTIRARRLGRMAADVLQRNAREAALLAAGPAMALLVEPDGRIEGPSRLAGALGMEALPERWDAFVDAAGLDGDQADRLRRAVVAAATGTEFSMTLASPDSPRFLRAAGGPAPAEFRQGSVLIWIFDVSESEEQATVLRRRLERRSAALEALSRLIELAPFGAAAGR